MKTLLQIFDEHGMLDNQPNILNNGMKEELEKRMFYTLSLPANVKPVTDYRARKIAHSKMVANVNAGWQKVKK